VWTCRAFAGVADVEAAAEAGPYLFAFDANEVGAVTAASASNPRVDIIYVQVDDPSEADGSAVPLVSRKYLAGVASASPVAPTAPVSSFVVARINVPVAGGGAPSVSWVAPYAVGAGGIIPVRDVAERDLISWGAAQSPAYVHRADTGALERNAGAGWVSVAGPQTRFWETQRTAGADAPFTTANTNLVSSSQTVPAGVYRVTGRAALYSAAGAIGSLFVTAGGVTQKVRWDLVGGTVPVSPEFTMMHTHPGGVLALAAGYDRGSGTPVCIASGTMVRAEFIGA